MVILVPRDHVENHAPIELLHVFVGQPQFSIDLKGLFIGIGTRTIKIEVCDGAKGLQMQLALHAVETSGHEVRAPMLFKKATLHHFYPRFNCHAVISVLDAPVASRISQGIIFHAVKLKHPVIKPTRSLDLTRSNFLRFIIQSDDGLGPIAPCRSAHT